MTWRDALRMALASGARRFGRTLLTALAVALASALLVALATIVVTANSRVLAQVSKGGPVTAIRVAAAHAQAGQLETDSLRTAGARPLTEADRAEIASLPGVTTTAGVLSTDVVAVPPEGPDVPDQFFDHAVGVDLGRPNDLPMTVVAGRLPSPDSATEVAVTIGYLDRLHLDADHPEAVLGTTVLLASPQVYQRSDGERDVRGRWVALDIVGVVAQDASPGAFVVPLEQTRAARAWTLDGISDGERLPMPTSEYSGLIVIADGLDEVHAVRARIDRLGFATSAPEQLIANVRRYLHVVDIVLGGVASIALVIASLGIANALLAAVRERRREIGVLKAIGARDRDVLRWFLIEAGLIGVVGGSVGTLLGVAIASAVGAVVNGYLTAEGLEGVRVTASPIVLAAGVVGAGLLSVVAGLVPARRAARMPAREAVGSL
jgi:hypothetical protein